MIAAIVDELAPELIKRNAIGYESASQLLISQVADFKKL
ncbi:transposase, N-terminal part domain protein [Shigella dysenteriae 1617]|nr:transposase, N-terminal part domain protein [Shigella dysenteriae 1617]